jgi:phospholipase C
LAAFLPLPAVLMFRLKLGSVLALAGLAIAVPSNIGYKGDWKSKIKNVIVLVEENRSFDTFAGGLSYNSAIDGLLHHNYCNSM